MLEMGERMQTRVGANQAGETPGKRSEDVNHAIKQKEIELLQAVQSA
jgi:hypothetical protein